MYAGIQNFRELVTNNTYCILRHVFKLRNTVYALAGILFWLGLILAPDTYAQESNPTYIIQIGDTWTALALRTMQPEADLRAAYGSINQQQQPTIGRIIDFPASSSHIRHGRLTRPLRGGLLEIAAGDNISPWQLAASQDLQHPYRPVLMRPVIQPGSFPLREMPPGFEWLELAPASPTPGEALAIRGQTYSETAVNVQLNQTKWNTGRNGRAFVAIGATGAFFDDKQAELFMHIQDQPAWSQPILFAPGAWTFEEIIYSGPAATISDADILDERKWLREIWSEASPTPYWQSDFRIPLDDFVEISSLYGARRAYNNGPYDRYHEGVDFSAYGGTPVYAPADGYIAVAEFLKVRGGSVIIDHGLGVHTGTYHLSEVSTAPGQQVKKGELIGAVGTTGLSTGNHLHWDFLIGTVWINGRSWLENELGCWLLAGLKTPCASPTNNRSNPNSL